LLEISEFCCETAIEIYRFSLVCFTWRQLMDCANGVYFWRRFKRTEAATSFGQFKQCLQGELLEIKQKRGVEFETMFTKLFNYGSTK
jgi:hypothetical protein